jgi:FO synthase
LGERPELRYPAAREWLDEHGYESTVHYLAEMAQAVLTETGLLPHANAGALSKDELALLRSASPSQGMMIESLNPDLECHRGSPDKTPERRLATLEAAGELQIPFTTGILIGIGESRQDRIDALEAIAASHQRHGHIQEVIVQNFLPKPGTRMHKEDPCPPEDHLDAIALARVILPPDISVQAPPNLANELTDLVDAGIDDLGGVDSWIAPELHFAVMDRSDAEGLGRDDPGAFFPERTMENAKVNDGAEVVLIGDKSTAWYSGADVNPQHLLPATARATGAVAEVLEGVRLGQEPSEDEIVTLFSARGPEVAAVAQLADELRDAVNGNVVTFVANRNINYTNVCTFKCQFCGFSKGPLSLNLRGAPYLLTLDDMAERVVEAAELGATEVCLQGGIHPDFDGDYYLDVIKAVHAAAPDIHIHGFTALEVTEGAKRLDEPLESYLQRLKDAGLNSLIGRASFMVFVLIRVLIWVV